MTAEAHAKINLRHRVFARDERGFHGVETLLARTSLVDSLEIEQAGEGLAIEVDGPQADGVPAGRDNLCWSAVERFMDAAFPRGKTRPGLRLHLTKRIPHGSGLGGGSSDAAATLRLLARRWPKLDEGDLVSMAGEIGSDVAFALLGVPMALGWERGRRLLPLRAPQPRPALLCCPPVRVSTPSAYGWLHDARAEEGDDPGGAAILPGATRLSRWDSVERLMRNDLQAPVMARHPELESALARLREHAPGRVAMTGSGSALFAIFHDPSEREQARDELEAELEDQTQLIEVTLPV